MSAGPHPIHVNPAIDPRGLDGVDHVNIWSKGDTKIGRELSNFAPCHIYSQFGSFRSIEGLIYYMGSHDEQLRFMHGFEAKKRGQAVDKGYRHKPEVFRDIIIEAMEQKWKGIDPKIRNTLKEKFDKLPLVHYYEYAGKRIVSHTWLWQVEEWERIRRG